MRRLLPALLLFALLAPASAAAQGTAVRGGMIGEAVQALAGDPVYVADDAEPTISAAEAEALRDRIAQANAGPVFIAVLPGAARDEAGGDASAVARRIANGLGRDGTYAVVAGGQFRAGSTRVRDTGEIATEALEARRDEGVAAVLSEFVDRLGDRASGGSGGGTGGGGGASAGALAALLALGAGAFGLVSLRRRRQRRAELEEVKDAARDDLVVLGDEIRTLDLDMEMPDANPQAKDHYGRAVGAYDRANRIFESARRPEDLEGFSAEVEEGRYAMTAARAVAAGGAPPERRPPCFFDPRHGPSDRDVEWAPPGGAPRAVPACEADAQRVDQGMDPAGREVMVGGRSMPYWNASPAFGPWAGGYFGGMGGGLLPGMLGGLALGSMFGALGPGTAYGQDGGGDFGGGDFGGGDFGGGDFGGGDFGGGGDF